MQSISILRRLAFSATAFADLHYNAVCVDTSTGDDLYNLEATKTACGHYFMRNKDSEWWNMCPDCTMITSRGTQLCKSAAKHIGGDEVRLRLHVLDRYENINRTDVNLPALEIP